MNALLFVVCALTISCLAQGNGNGNGNNNQNFKCAFELRHPDMSNGGFVSGTMSYSWTNRAVLFQYESEYEELFTFNENRGYGEDRHFDEQFVYRSGGDHCENCETAAISYGMPVFFADDTYLTAGANSRYTPVDQEISNVDSVYIENGVLLKASFTDDREFSFFDCKTQNGFGNVFNAPANCKCGVKLDIVLVLDRSGSINLAEFRQEKQFVQDFSNAFEYGPQGAYLGITHFNRITWDTLKLEEGIFKENVQTGVESMQCCDDRNPQKDTDRCCCCGTAVSSGMRNGALMLKTSTRDTAGKILITLTDGYHNRPYVGLDANGKPEGRDPACRTNEADKCSTDLIDAATWVKEEIPGVILYAVAVGVNADALQAELEVIAGGSPDRIIVAADFDRLPAVVSELVSKTCDENAKPCGSCCGLCTCGTCTAVSGCDPKNQCFEREVTGLCCTETPLIGDNDPCIDPTKDQCFTYKCNAATGECDSTENPLQERDLERCLDFECDTTTGLPVPIKFEAEQGQTCGPICDINGNGVEDDCNDFNECTIEECVLEDPNDPASAMCVHRNLTEPCDDNNACTEDSCDRELGCVFTDKPPCDDQNNCTIDTCDPTSTNDSKWGHCVFTEKECEAVDVCHEVECDPFQGCLVVPIECPTSDNCTIAGCEVENETGCTVRDEDCGLGIAAIAGLTAGVIAGIVVAAIFGALLLSGGAAAAFTHSAGAPLTGAIESNPIYKDAGNSGSSPLYR